MARIIDGRAHAMKLQEEVAAGVAALGGSHGVAPCLAVILVGSDPASLIYVARKRAAAKAVRLNSREYRLPEDTDEASLLAALTPVSGWSGQ